MGIIISSGAKKADMSVSEVNGAGNSTINQLIGNRLDDEATASTIYAFLHDLWEGLHHAQLLYPDLAVPVTVTTHADAYTLGNFAEIVPANAIATEFHIHHLHLSTPSANGQYVLVLYEGTTELARVSFSRTDKKDDVEGLDVRMAHCPANSQIQAKLASSNAASPDTVNVRLWYHSH